MNLLFEKITDLDPHKVDAVYRILMKCGEFMYLNQGLPHWKTPYPKEAILKNCLEREVYVAREQNSTEYIHTFQLEFKFQENDNKAILYKFATLPEMSGRGIGNKSMEYIEECCRLRKISKICLDVYDKSEHAIRFYKKRGFHITGTAKTRHFTVFLMEKIL